MKRAYISVIMAASMSLAGCEALSDQISNLRGGKSKTNAVATAPNSASVTETAAKSVKPLGYLLDVNEATEKQLRGVPGVTPEIHKLIKNTRPFLDMVELNDELERLGLSASERRELYTHVFMVIDINNGVMEDLQFVPNLSKSQAFDIENGRPYKNRDALKKVIEKVSKPDAVDRLMPYFKVKKAQK